MPFAFSFHLTLLGLLVLAAPLHGAPESPPLPDLPDLVSRVTPAIASILTFDDANRPRAQGSGFFVSVDGLFVTNHHVVAGAPKLFLKRSDGAFFAVQEVVGLDVRHDLALLRADGSGFQALKLADSATVRVGESVIAMGSPLSLEASVSTGIVSGIRKTESNIEFQTTAPISPGSSGGPS
jgi:S1-C subfamily serine protease